MARSGSKAPAKTAAEEAANSENPIQDQDLLEFIKAIDDYRRKNNRPFPNWSEILLIVHALGYKKAEDQREENKEG